MILAYQKTRVLFNNEKAIFFKGCKIKKIGKRGIDILGVKELKPTVHKGPPGLLEGFRETSAMIDIEDAAVTEFKGKSQIRSAYPAQFAGSTSTFTSKINEPLVQTPGGEPGYKMTQADIARQDAISAAEARGQGVGLNPTVTRQEVGGGHDIKIYTDPETKHV